MCGQFQPLLQFKRLMEALRLESVSEAMAPEVVKPTLAAPIVIANPDHGGLEIAPMRFGLVPHWYKKSIKDFKATTFNARVEEVDAKPVFKGAYRYRRAIVPAESFFEWSGPKTDRSKWRITRGDNQVLAFAGVWDQADCLEGEMFSFAILTRDAGADMTRIHTREPVVLGEDHWEDWLRLRPVDLYAPAPLRITPADGAKPGGNFELF